jgi:hypothetical protein
MNFSYGKNLEREDDFSVQDKKILRLLKHLQI